MAPSVPALTDHLGYRLRQVSNHVSHTFARKMAAQGVTVAEWGVLRTLYGRKPMAPSRLADEMGMTRGAITRLADRLIGKGLVARSASPDDGRAQTLRLTAKATAFVPRLAGLAEQNEAECFAHLSNRDRSALSRILSETVSQLGLTGVPID